jgi:uncharacterized membrane protein
MPESPTPAASAGLEAGQAISELHRDHYRKATAVQRLLDGMVARLGHPMVLLLLTLTMLGWIAVNLTVYWSGSVAPDPPPFALLQTIAAIIAVFMTTLILSTQRREDTLARHRDQLMLELAIMGERKSAKIIALLEELRRDTPLVPDRVDDDAALMTRPADPGAVLSAIQDIQREVAEEHA